MSERDLQEFMCQEISKSASPGFYWESDELDDVVDYITTIVAKAIDENNERFARDLARAMSRVR